VSHIGYFVTSRYPVAFPSTSHRQSHFQAIQRKPRFAAEYPRKIADMGQFFSKANPALVAM
jgi:hypothetical protein